MVTIKVDKLTEQVQIISDLPEFVLTYSTLKALLEQVERTESKPGELVIFNLEAYVPTF